MNTLSRLLQSIACLWLAVGMASPLHGGVIINSYRFGGGGGGADPYFANVVLLLHGEGANNSTTFTDSSPLARTITPAGNAQIKTDQFKFGSASMRFDGTGDYVSTSTSSDFNIGATNWSLEFWLRPNVVLNNQRLIVFEGTSFNWGLIALSSGNDLAWDRFGSSPSITATGALASGKLGAWYFIALIKTGGTIELFIDGASQGTTTTLPASDNYNLIIGASVVRFAAANLNAWVDDVRFTTLARANTVPAAQFPDS
jgi:hypothetical protein